MQGISYIKLNKKITHRITEAFIDEGYRILRDEEGRTWPVAWIGEDGESDRIFPTHQEAEKVLLEYGEKLKKFAGISDYEILS